MLEDPKGDGRVIPIQPTYMRSDNSVKKKKRSILLPGKEHSSIFSMVQHKYIELPPNVVKTSNTKHTFIYIPEGRIMK